MQLTPIGYGLRPILPGLSAGPLPLTSRGRLRPPGVSRHSASCVRNLATVPPSVSRNRLPCALEAVSAHNSHLKPPPVCKTAPPCTRRLRPTLSRVHWSSSPHTTVSSCRLPCAKPSRFAPISLAKPPLVCTRDRFYTQKHPSKRNGQSNSRRGEPSRSSPQPTVGSEPAYASCRCAHATT